MPETTRPIHRHPDRWRGLALFAAAAVFLFFVWRFHIPGRGFTALITFGGNQAERYLAEIDPETTHITPQSAGYDAQWYAELAVVPDLQDPRLAPAIDNLPYRARRILFCWTAYAAGFGEPRRVLAAFALQNVVSWLLLGLLLLRWLPPTGWDNVARWLAVMFSFGLVFSVRCALVDGPSLLLIALGVALLERGRPWLAALVLGANGLGKETNILAAGAPAWPQEPTLRAWGAAALRCILVFLPLALWTAYTLHLFGVNGDEAGTRNFALPFAEFGHRAVASVRELLNHPPVLAYSLGGVFTIVSLGTQLLFFVLRPRWRDPWWRIGLAFGVLMAFLGESVWEGYPSAAARVLLPMLLAFNLTLPRGARWWPVFLLGNLTLLSTPNFVRLPVGAEPAILETPASFARDPALAGPFRSELAGPWYPSEQSLYDTWRWTAGSVEIVVLNPNRTAAAAALDFGLNSRNARFVAVEVAGLERWRGTATPDRQDVRVGPILLPPGETRIRFLTDRPAERTPGGRDSRELAFRLLDLRLRLRAATP